MQHDLRPHPGQAASAANLLAAGAGRRSSPPTVTATPGCRTRTRCGAPPRSRARSATPLAHARSWPTVNLRSAIDNPVVLADGTMRSNGNFHGAPLAYVLDFLAICVADLSFDRRAPDRPPAGPGPLARPAPLPGRRPGRRLGLMIAQYAQAAMVSENKRLASPASVDSIPSSAMQEDHVSMGWDAGRKLRLALHHLSSVLAVELVAAARAIELRAPLPPVAGHRRGRCVIARGGPGYRP